MKHSLVEHWNNVSLWWHDTNDSFGANQDDRQVILILAYERWLNNRQLLTDEDNYQWNHPLHTWIGQPPGWIGPWKPPTQD